MLFIEGTNLKHVFCFQFRRTGLTYGNGATVAYGRSWAGDLLSLVHAWGSAPNNLGGGSGVTFTHGYAPDHRLASTSVSSTAFEWKPATGGATPLGTDIFNPANLLNQLTQVTLSGTAARSVTWDAAGNMTTDSVLTYVHDAENRLTNVTRTTPSLNATYTYDPMGRRVQRNVNGTSIFTLHDGDEEIAEYDATGALIRRFIPGPGTDEPIAIVVPGVGGGAIERRFFHEDRIGNVIAMSGRNAGNTAPILAEGPFTYDAYGRSPQPLGTSATSTPFRYTGRRLDAETGNYYYRARFYTPTLGQFIETDPVGYADSMNLYAYVGGDPVNAVDPSGRDAVPSFIPTWMCGGDGACRQQMIDDSVAIKQYEAVGAAIALAIVAIPVVINAVILSPTVMTRATTAIGDMLLGEALGGASIGTAALGAGAKGLASTLNRAKQGKHIPGHNNYLPGRSILTHSDPQGLLTSKAGTGKVVNGIPAGQAGSKEVVDFGVNIGTHISGTTGKATPTSVGTIHYSKKDAHIVPAHPSSPARN